MTMSDPISDMITRIRNGQKARKKTVLCPTSKFKLRVLKVLKDEGYIRDFHQDGRDVAIELKYEQGLPVIRQIERASKPGRRLYTEARTMPKFYNGLGVSIISTPRGVMTDHQAREANVGGEVLCRVY